MSGPIYSNSIATLLSESLKKLPYFQKPLNSQTLISEICKKVESPSFEEVFKRKVVSISLTYVPISILWFLWAGLLIRLEFEFSEEVFYPSRHLLFDLYDRSGVPICSIRVYENGMCQLLGEASEKAMLVSPEPHPSKTTQEADLVNYYFLSRNIKQALAYCSKSANSHSRFFFVIFCLAKILDFLSKFPP